MRTAPGIISPSRRIILPGERWRRPIRRRPAAPTYNIFQRSEDGFANRHPAGGIIRQAIPGLSTEAGDSIITEGGDGLTGEPPHCCCGENTCRYLFSAQWQCQVLGAPPFYPVITPAQWGPVIERHAYCGDSPPDYPVGSWFQIPRTDEEWAFGTNPCTRFIIMQGTQTCSAYGDCYNPGFDPTFKESFTLPALPTLTADEKSSCCPTKAPTYKKAYRCFHRLDGSNFPTDTALDVWFETFDVNPGFAPQGIRTEFGDWIFAIHGDPYYFTLPGDPCSIYALQSGSFPGNTLAAPGGPIATGYTEIPGPCTRPQYILKCNITISGTTKRCTDGGYSQDNSIDGYYPGIGMTGTTSNFFGIGRDHGAAGCPGEGIPWNGPTKDRFEVTSGVKVGGKYDLNLRVYYGMTSTNPALAFESDYTLGSGSIVVPNCGWVGSSTFGDNWDETYSKTYVLTNTLTGGQASSTGGTATVEFYAEPV